MVIYTFPMAVVILILIIALKEKISESFFFYLLKYKRSVFGHYITQTDYI